MSPPATTSVFLDPFTSPREIARWAVLLLAASVAVAWIAAGVDVAQLHLLFQARGGESIGVDSRTAQSIVGRLVFWVELAMLSAGGLLFLVWLFQARVNVRALGARRLAYAREWTWGAFLVPVLNLFRPYQVVREVWQASDPGELDPFAWRSRPVPPIVPAWWTCCLVTVLLAALSISASSAGSAGLSRITLGTVLSLAAHATWAAAACLACLLVARISDAQEEKWSRQQAEAERAPRA